MKSKEWEEEEDERCRKRSKNQDGVEKGKGNR